MPPSKVNEATEPANEQNYTMSDNELAQAKPQPTADNQAAAQKES